MSKPVTPAQRKKRIVRDVLILLACLVLLVIVRDFPIPTAELALAATQQQELFGPGEVITVLDYVDRTAPNVSLGHYDRYYILRDGEFYAWCGIDYDGFLTWRTGWLEAVKNDPSVPLVPLIIDPWWAGAALVVSNDPEIVRVEVLFPAQSSEDGGGWEVYVAQEGEQTDGCYVVLFGRTARNGHVFYKNDFVFQGFDAAGELVYQSPSRSGGRPITI